MQAAAPLPVESLGCGLTRTKARRCFVRRGAASSKGHPNMSDLTVAELDAKSVELKQEIEALRDERRALKKIRDEKVVIENLAQRLGIEVDGITPEQAKALIELANGTRREGDVVVSPGPGDLSAATGTPEVD